MGKERKVKIISIFDVVFAAVLSIFSVLVYNVYLYHDFKFISDGNLLNFFLKTLLFFVCFLGVAALTHFFEIKLNKWDYEIRIFEPGPRGVLKGTILISLCYLPVAVIFYPGVCSWDTINQLNDYLTGTEPLWFDWIPGQEKVSAFLNDHHPVVDTFIFVFFYKAGELFGDLKIGIFLYSLSMMVSTAAAFSYMLCFINKLKIRLPRIPLLIFVLAHPVLSVYSFSMIKDSVFSMFFVWWFVIYISMLSLKTAKRRFIALLVLTFILALTKKTGIYIVIPSNVALLFAKVRSDSKWRPFVVSSVIAPAILMFLILPKLVFPAANIYPGGKQEMLGPLFQQSARVEIDDPGHYQPEEKEVLRKVIDYDHIKENYKYEVSDGIKDTYNLHAGSEDISAYLKLWSDTGLKKPLSYIKATIGNCGGLFTPAKKIAVHRSMTEQDLVQGMDNIGIFKPCREFYLKVVDTISGIPVISFVFENVLFSFWIPLFFIVRSIKKKNRNSVISMIPVIISVLLLIVSPITHIRYALPLVYCSPLLIALGLRLDRKISLTRSLTRPVKPNKLVSSISEDPDNGIQDE